ncbi:CrcB family protein [Nesterenkonia sp. Act20]|uniref:fluoride efflux transporter FluC n=1 Tax=Nesterenkonia sp. Act20 TaxID=1483432 RepID=UPI001C457BDF|nr:CrcB family protein [Nesterenkonia sp. Act20]
MSTDLTSAMTRAPHVHPGLIALVALGDTPLFSAATLGFCGGYTTFSTAMVETVRFVQGGDHLKALLNVLGTAVLTVTAAAGGLALAGLIL